MFLTLTTIMLLSPNTCASMLGPQTLNSAACPPVFGSNSEHAAVATKRKSLIDSVLPGGACLDITYSGEELAPPEEISFANVQLLGTIQREGCEPAALVEVLPDLARSSGCTAGVYGVHVDDKIGLKNYVVAIFNGGVLLARGQRLRALVPKDRSPPTFRMIWQSHWRLPEPRASGSAGPTPFYPGVRR